MSDEGVAMMRYHDEREKLAEDYLRGNVSNYDEMTRREKREWINYALRQINLEQTQENVKDNVDDVSCKKKKKQQSPCCVYDFTLFDNKNHHLIRKQLSEVSKKYCFQLEQGEKTGTKHYQGRMSLKHKKRINDVIEMMKQYWDKYHISITSSANRDNNFYVMKEETRLDGPFTSENYKYIPRDVREVIALYEWQQFVVSTIFDYTVRMIDLFYDPYGKEGKTTLSRWLDAYYGARMLPPLNNYKDFMRMAKCCTINMEGHNIYCIDVPRGLAMHKMSELMTGIESLKTGYIYDDRYVGGYKPIDPPRVLVFCNTMPDLKILSEDKWRIWAFSEVNKHQLITYSEYLEEQQRIKIEMLEDIENDKKAEHIDHYPFIQDPTMKLVDMNVSMLKSLVTSIIINSIN